MDNLKAETSLQKDPYSQIGTVFKKRPYDYTCTVVLKFRKCGISCTTEWICNSACFNRMDKLNASHPLSGILREGWGNCIRRSG